MTYFAFETIYVAFGAKQNLLGGILTKSYSWLTLSERDFSGSVL